MLRCNQWPLLLPWHSRCRWYAIGENLTQFNPYAWYGVATVASYLGYNSLGRGDKAQMRRIIRESLMGFQPSDGSGLYLAFGQGIQVSLQIIKQLLRLVRYYSLFLPLESCDFGDPIHTSQFGKVW